MPNWFTAEFFHWHYSRLAEQITYLGQGEWQLPRSVVMTVDNLEEGEWTLHYKGQELDVETTEHDPRM